MESEIPSYAIAQLDQAHAAAEERLTIVIDECVATGLHDFAGPERAIGIGLALRDRPIEDVFEIASHALSRLIEQETRTQDEEAPDGE